MSDTKDGWLLNGEIFWVDEVIPGKMEKILQEVDHENKDYAIEGYVKTDDGDEFKDSIC